MEEEQTRSITQAQTLCGSLYPPPTTTHLYASCVRTLNSVCVCATVLSSRSFTYWKPIPKVENVCVIVCLCVWWLWGGVYIFSGVMSWKKRARLFLKQKQPLWSGCLIEKSPLHCTHCCSASFPTIRGMFYNPGSFEASVDAICSVDGATPYVVRRTLQSINANHASALVAVRCTTTFKCAKCSNTDFCCPLLTLELCPWNPSRLTRRGCGALLSF